MPIQAGLPYKVVCLIVTTLGSVPTKEDQSALEGFWESKVLPKPLVRTPRPTLAHVAHMGFEKTGGPSLEPAHGTFTRHDWLLTPSLPCSDRIAPEKWFGIGQASWRSPKPIARGKNKAVLLSKLSDAVLRRAYWMMEIADLQLGSKESGTKVTRRRGRYTICKYYPNA